MNEIGHINVSYDPDRNLNSMVTVLNLRSRENMTASVLSEDIYTNWLDQTFKSMFDEFDSRGMPTQNFLRILRRDSFGIPRQRLNRFIIKLDSNKDGKVTYDEFRLFMLHIEPRDMSFAKKVLISLALKSCPDLINSYLLGDCEENVIREEERHKLKSELAESYLDAYSCYPPPVFIPIVLVAQMTVFVVYGLQMIDENDPRNHLSWTTGIPKQSPLIFDIHKRVEIWRFVSYMLIHQVKIFNL